MALFPYLASLNQSFFAGAANKGEAPPSPHWSPWLERFCAGLGLTLLLTGIIYFFAFNWAAMPPWLKFSTVEVGCLLCLAGVWRWGVDAFKGQLCVCGASVMVGLFLAVFGQIYQTGANTWQLFASWAAFITIWTALTRFAPQWAILLLLLNTALFLYHARGAGLLITSPSCTHHGYGCRHWA